MCDLPMQEGALQQPMATAAGARLLRKPLDFLSCFHVFRFAVSSCPSHAISRPTLHHVGAVTHRALRNCTRC